VGSRPRLDRIIRVKVFALVALAGCGLFGKTPAPAPVAAPAPPVCITPPDESGAITHPLIERDTVRYCIGETAQCFVLDLASGKLAKAKLPPDPAEPKLCTDDACRKLTAKLVANPAEPHAATNAAGTLFVVALGDAAAGQGYVEVWDVAKTKKLTTFRYARGDFKCGDVAMLDDTIYVSAGQCTSPAARGALYTLKGKKIADVGGKDFGVFGNGRVHLDGNDWAFLEESATRVVIQDVVTGKVAKTIDLATLWGDKPDAMGNPGESVVMKLPAGKLAVIAGSPMNGSVAVVDPANGDVKVTRAQLCH